MSIRPVDLQVIVQKSSEVSRVNNQNQRHDAQAQVFADMVKKEVTQNEQQVTHSHKSEQDNINKDGKGNNSYGKNNKNKRNTKEEEKKQKPKSTSMFDVTI